MGISNEESSDKEEISLAPSQVKQEINSRIEETNKDKSKKWTCPIERHRL